MTIENWAKHLDGILTSTGENFLTRNGMFSHLQEIEKAQTKYKNIRQKCLAMWKRIIWKA